MSKNIARIGIIGTGWWTTQAHIPALKDYTDTEIVALCDSDLARLKNTSAFYDISKTYTDFHEMIDNENMDGVLIATSNDSHHQIAKYALEHELHLLIEKPMTEKAKHGKELLDLSKKYKKEIVIGYTFHYTPLAQKARKIVQSGKLGDVYLASSTFDTMVIEFIKNNPEAYRNVFNWPVHGPTPQNFSKYGQGQMQLTHSVALMLFITDLLPKKVHSFMSNFEVDVDLADIVNVLFENEALGSLSSIGNIPIGDTEYHELKIFCSQGYLTMDMLRSGKLYIRTHDGKEDGLTIINEYDKYPIYAPARNLVDVILGRDENHSPPIIAQRAVEIVEAAYKSAASGKIVTIYEL